MMNNGVNPAMLQSIAGLFGNSQMPMNGGGGGQSPMNPMQAISQMGINPEQMAMNMLEQAAPNNPFAATLLNLAKNNQGEQIEQNVRNYFQQMGINFDQALKQFMQGKL